MDFSTFSSFQNQLNFICRQGVKQGVFPGVTAAVSIGSGREKKRIFSASGKTRLDKKAVEVRKNTFFDLASLTKPLATTLLAFHLIETGVFDLNDRLKNFNCMKMPQDKENITIAHLLSHSSGLSSYKPYFERYRPYPDKENKEKLVNRIMNDPMEYKIGTDCRYSDLGFILLGYLLEQLSGQALDSLFTEKILVPLELEKDIFYLPLPEKNTNPSRLFAATEYCNWRNRIIQGEVHDEHAFLMGGVAGHAGLFGTADGVVTLLEHILTIWQGRNSQLPVGQSLLKKALQRKYTERSWGLGFDTPSTEYTSAGKYFSKKSAGHLGYTGTSFWIDPEKECIAVLLTNRVHPSRENKKIREYRPWFHNRIIELLREGI